jgi:hypothetical protein
MFYHFEAAHTKNHVKWFVAALYMWAFILTIFFLTNPPKVVVTLGIIGTVITLFTGWSGKRKRKGRHAHSR